MVNLFPLIPLSIAILFAIKLSVIYLLAVYYGHVNPIYPYISDAGTTHPEAGYFSMLLILEAILIGIFGWIRFKQIRYIFANSSEINSNDNKPLNNNQIKRIHKFNKYGLYLSIIVMLGMSGVAAFRSTEHLELHLVGANPAFFGLFFYFLIQTWFSYKLIPTVNTKRMAYFRLIIVILTFILGIVMIFAIIVSVAMSKVTYAEIRSAARLKWDESHGGYVAHCISTIAENLAIFCVTPFYASFFIEFKRIQSHNGRLKFNFIGQSIPENIRI